MENLYNEDLDIYVISLPDAKDPDEFIKSGGDFQEEMKKALTPIAFYIKE
ncbi:hypothetical protein GW830_05140 [bacterium]|nr:hypothetical protein [bacterium]